MGTEGGPAREQRLLEEFKTYDEHVDVVSALEWLFTDPTVDGLPATVSHFERFPKIPVADNKELTPDFTVLFQDGMAIIGEIAKFALHENSVDKLCKQLGNYANITRVPNGRGFTEVSQPDVLYLVPMKIGLEAVPRIIGDRYANADHDYKPAAPPCIVQYARDDTTYSFQRLPDSANGVLNDGSREPALGRHLERNVNIAAANFVHVKAKRAFINDPVAPLYMATHLWGRTIPAAYGASGNDVVLDPRDVAELLRKQYGVGRVRDVRAAFELLSIAGLAALETDGRWTVARRRLGRSGDSDIHKDIAKRASTPQRRLVRRRRTAEAEEQVQTQMVLDL